MTDQTPRTEAGRDHHDLAWANHGDINCDHTYEREGCPGCAHDAAIEAQAREPYLANMQRLAEANEAYGREIDRLAQARAEALREAAERVRALPWYGMFAARDRTIDAILTEPER